jgi:hypothetical protein
MKRFLVLALVGPLGVAGGTSLAFGASNDTQPGSKPQATKVSPTPTPSTPQTQVKKPVPPVRRPDPKKENTGGRIKEKSMPKSGERPPTPKGPTKAGKGEKSGKGSYSWNDYKRDLDKDYKELEDGVKEGVESVSDGLSDTGKFIGSWFNNDQSKGK